MSGVRKQLLKFLWEAAEEAKEACICNQTGRRQIGGGRGVLEREREGELQSDKVQDIKGIVCGCVSTCCLNNVDRT